MKKEEIDFPTHYDEELKQVFDSSSNLVVDTRTWGNLSWIDDDGNERVEAIGQYLSDSMNEEQEKDSE